MWNYSECWSILKFQYHFLEDHFEFDEAEGGAETRIEI